jgi:hypothetical protein
MWIAAVCVGLLVLVRRCVRIPGIAVGRIPRRPGGVPAVIIVPPRVPSAVLLEELLQEIHHASSWKRDDTDKSDA